MGPGPLRCGGDSDPEVFGCQPGWTGPDEIPALVHLSHSCERTACEAGPSTALKDLRQETLWSSHTRIRRIAWRTG
jgi:hypothetical protein